MDKAFVTIIGIVSIIGIWKFFFGKKEEAIVVSDSITIIIDGGYKPSTIRIPQGKPVTLTFLRRDPNTCLEEVVFPDYKIKEYVPLNKKITITLSPPHPTKSGFHCAMNMFHGRIVVV